MGILIFDYKGDYNESKHDFIDATNATILKPYQLPFNPLSLTKSKVFKPLLPIHTANAFKDTISKVYGLGPKQQDTLFQCIIETYAICGIQAANPSSWDNEAPTFEQVYQTYANDAYYGTTPQKKMEARIIRRTLRKDLSKFKEYVREYQEAENEEEKEDIEMLLKRELKDSSAFTAFKRWLLWDNEEKYGELEKFIPENQKKN